MFFTTKRSLRLSVKEKRMPVVLHITNLELAEQKLLQLQTRQKCMPKLLKETKEDSR